LTELLIHNFLGHLHHDKEFYYVSSLEEVKRIINYFGEVIDKAIEEFDDDYIKLQDMYIQSDIIIELNDKTINKVIDTLTYDIEEELVELEFENGSIIKCTKDHEIFTSNRGFVAADSLTENDDIVYIS